MFQSVAATQDGVTGRVRHHQPGRSRREMPETLGTMLLKVLVDLQEVVEAKHEGVIGRAARPAWLEDVAHAMAQAADPARSSRRRQPCFAAVTGEQLGERVRRDPDARFLRVDVYK